MSERYSTWKEAHDAAVRKARLLGCDVAIRGVKEYGRLGYNINIASRNDSDYAKAEIVTPRDPL